MLFVSNKISSPSYLPFHGDLLNDHCVPPAELYLVVKSMIWILVDSVAEVQHMSRPSLVEVDQRSPLAVVVF